MNRACCFLLVLVLTLAFSSPVWAETGKTKAAPRDAGEPQAIRVVLANLHVLAGIPPIPKEGLPKAKVLNNLDRAVRLFKQENADVLLLQEVDFSAWRTGHVRQLDELAERLSMNAALATTYDSRGLNEPVQVLRNCHFGVAILSRFPIVRQDVIPLSPDPMKGKQGRAVERRVLLIAELALPAQRSMVVATTHLDAQDAELRRRQRRWMRDALQTWLEHHPVLLGGDFNEPLLAERETLPQAIRKKHDWGIRLQPSLEWPFLPNYHNVSSLASGKTYPYPNALVDIDRFHRFGSGMSLLHIKRLDSRGLSDHYFVKALVRVD